MCPNLIINQDNFDLTQSENKTLDEKNWDNEINLCLDKFTGNSFIFGAGKIIGIVKDENDKRIEDVIVILMISKAEVILQVKTDASGEYLIENIPEGTYFLMTKYSGKKDQKTDDFFLAPLSIIKRDFILKSDDGGLVGIILGSVFGGGVALVGVAVGIYFAGNLIATAVTGGAGGGTGGGAGGAGAFLVGGLVAGLTYLVSIFQPGFIPQTFQQVARTPEEIENNPEDNDHDLEIDYSFTCTVSGIIADPNGIPIHRADVILYRVELNDNLNPVVFMKTNREGLYLFKVPLGKYLIKSSQNTTITVDY